MIVYIDHAFQRRKAAGLINSLDDIIAAHMEGTVQRVRPKLMTVSTMLIGLLPLLWATTTGADVMKRIAAPMVGGLLTSAFLTLELIPVVYTYWRGEELLWRRPAARSALQAPAVAVALAAGLLLAAAVAPVYLTLPPHLAAGVALAAALAVAGASALYLLRRRSALFAPIPDRDVAG